MTLVALCVWGWPAGAVAADCQAASHREFGWDLTPDLRYAQIAVSPKDLTVETLLCAARTVAGRHPPGRRFMAVIFDDVDAARRFYHLDAFSDVVPPEAPLPPRRRAAQAKHAVAFYRSEPGESPQDGISLFLFGAARREPGQLTSYDGNGVDPPGLDVRCRFEWAQRCVIRMDYFTYPVNDGRRRPEASVTVRGRVRRDGRVTAVRVVTDGMPADPDTRRLGRAAVAQLRSWQLEPAAREDEVRFVYTYKEEEVYPIYTSPDRVLRKEDELLVDIELPRITILGSPIR